MPAQSGGPREKRRQVAACETAHNAQVSLTDRRGKERSTIYYRLSTIDYQLSTSPYRCHRLDELNAIVPPMAGSELSSVAISHLCLPEFMFAGECP